SIGLCHNKNMEIKDFQNLREIQSLDALIGKHLQNINEHQGRIANIKEQRSLRQEELEKESHQYEQLKPKLNKLETKLQQVITNLEKAKDRLTHMKTPQQVSATEKEIDSLEAQRQEIEDETLELMEILENFESKIEQHSKFLKGSAKSLEEISGEVSKEVAKEEKNISNLEDRIANLTSITDPRLISHFNQVNKKFRFKKPLSHIEQRSCSQCSFVINGQMQQEVENRDKINFCPGCKRLLIPQTAL
ncbi:MAG: zinc ribbon domain-containing protein, partial [Bacteriovoracia bacterium]